VTAKPGAAGPNNTQIIARNSLWYGLELLSTIFAALLVSVIVARVLGPERLGYYSYVMTLTNFTSVIGCFGLPMTTRKYMAEYLNRGQPGLARSIYVTALRIQCWIAAALTGVALVIVFTLGDRTQHVISALLVLNMAPRMIGFIPSQANSAAEALERNAFPSVISIMLSLSLTLFSLWMGWDLPGVASAVLLGTLVDAGLKLRSVRVWMRDTVQVPIPRELRRQLLVFSGQGLALMALNVVVWDRSDVYFLKNLNPQIAQVTFFSQAFGFVEKLLMAPNAFGGSLGVTLMAQYGRGQSRLNALTVEGGRYAFLIALPLLAGIACVSGPAVLLVWGEQYRPMIPVLATVALLAIPKAMVTAPTTLLQATEKQGFLVVWGTFCGAINVALDILLIPRHGAVGAAIANGSAQTLAAIGVWFRAWQLFRLDLRLRAFARIAAAGVAMSITAVALSRLIGGYVGLAAAILSGMLVWFAVLRWTGAMDKTDGQRFLTVGRALPGRVRPFWNGLVNLVAPGAE
jgi:O-antigen/teichoic acid export membrane protein